MSSQAAQGIGEVTLEAKVIRADGSVEDLGVLAYWSPNPLRRLLARLRGWGKITVGGSR